jgi:hypothetical protein
VFCNQLNSSAADDVLASLISVGLNALSLRFRKKPISDDAKDVVKLTATFASEACPLWVPGLIPDRPVTPRPAWYPSGFTPLVADPDVAWRWIEPEEAICSGGLRCWNVDVVARQGCPMDVSMAVAANDAAGVVVDVGFGSLGSTAPNEVRRVELTSNVAAATEATVDYIACS